MERAAIELTSEIRLDSRHGNHDLVVTFALDLLPAPAEVIVAAKLHDIRHEIITLDYDVFHNLTR